MKIKEVEILTGLTAKSIRYYESKGLLVVGRQEGNDYRDYTEENVWQLKRIKLLRYLDFSVDQIRDMLSMDADGLKKILLDKMEQLDNESKNLELKRNLCHSLSKSDVTLDHIVDEYIDAIDILEESEELKDVNCYTFSELFGYTGIFLGPILWLFLNIHDQKWDVLPWSAIGALVSAAVITHFWMNYWKQRKFQPKHSKRIDQSDWYTMPSILLGVVTGSIIFLLFFYMEELYMEAKGWLFIQVPGFGLDWGPVTICYSLITFPLMYFFSGILRIIAARAKKVQVEKPFIFVRKYWFICLPIWLLGMYLCLTRFTVVTDSHIICHTPLCPQGKVYSYEDVTHVKTGFGQKLFSIHEHERLGEFYYIVTLDEKDIVFHNPGTNGSIERYEEHRYLEFEELDAALMKLGIEKEASAEGVEDCTYDQETLERLLKILNN